MGNSRTKNPRDSGNFIRNAVVATSAPVKNELFTTSLNSSVPAPKTLRS